jgi:hypothetical protein
MANRGQTHAKRARELELKERRERKREKKALRAEGNAPEAANGSSATNAGAQAETEAAEWSQ